MAADRRGLGQVSPSSVAGSPCKAAQQGPLPQSAGAEGAEEGDSQPLGPERQVEPPPAPAAPASSESPQAKRKSGRQVGDISRRLYQG